MRKHVFDSDKTFGFTYTTNTHANLIKLANICNCPNYSFIKPRGKLKPEYTENISNRMETVNSWWKEGWCKVTFHFPLRQSTCSQTLLRHTNIHLLTLGTNNINSSTTSLLFADVEKVDFYPQANFPDGKMSTNSGIS